MELATTIILALVGFLQVLLMFLIIRIFKTLDTLSDKIDSNRNLASKALEKSSDKHIKLLEDHYVTNGQLTTLESDLMGEIKLLRQSIQNFTKQLGIALVGKVS